MLHKPWRVRPGPHFPQLLEANAVLLWLPALLQTELGDDLLCQRPARALGDDRVFAEELHAAGEAVRGLAVSADPHVAGGNTLDGATLVVKHLGGGKAGEDLHPELGRLLREPPAQVAKAHDVVA